MHSTGSTLPRRQSVVRPASAGVERTGSGISRVSAVIRWFGAIWRVCSKNQAESCVSTRPLPGMPPGKTTSNALSRSEATSSSLSSNAKISRTLPVARCWSPGISIVRRIWSATAFTSARGV